MPPGATKLGRAAGEARILTDSSGRQTHSSTASSPPSAQQTQAEGKAAGDEAERASPSSEDKTAYTVQLGAFVSKENALDFSKKLSSLSIVASLVEGRDSSGTPLFFCAFREIHPF